MKYSQTVFKLDKKGGQTVLSLSKLAGIPIRIHRTSGQVRDRSHGQAPLSTSEVGRLSEVGWGS
ncbi:hypothetical protein CK500_15395 [Halorubrum salipaludis]|uniref:Uncharacterized protein n=1 Tax=Halorubrum salipaludis TaxID=2032630 RepID=A0A2A2F6N2_9EURY|nr:hypothetical protein CK500_15395 [Halorubrum salipaludis]